MTRGERPYTPVTGTPYVASFTPVANFAVGDETPWGIAAELERLLPGTETGSYDESSADSALADAGERRVVAVVRDLHRHPWMIRALDALLAAVPTPSWSRWASTRRSPAGPCTSPRTARPGSAAAPPPRP